MSDVVNNAAEIQLYSDLIKIGIPSLVGILATLSTGIIPLLMEKSKQKESINIENRTFRREKITELITLLSDYSGSLSHHLSARRSLKSYHHDDIKKQVSNTGFEYFSNLSKLKKAIAIAYLLNEPSIGEKIQSFDDQICVSLNFLFQNDDHEASEAELNRSKLKKLENDLFLELSLLSD
jgi:hypothetical protein